jgi:kynurenine 3-monooxygenase
MTQKSQPIRLIGAGLTGPLLAIELVKRGFEVEIYERRPDMRRVGISAGRSINLALSARGIHALTHAGLWNEMQKIIVPMKGRMMHSPSSEITFQPYSRNESDVINSISRAELNIALINAAEAHGVRIHFQMRCAGMNLNTGKLQMHQEQADKGESIDADVVVGCDGSTSAIRGEMLKRSRFNFSQQYLDYGYKELTIPAGSASQHLLEPHALHIWPRGSYMLIALPNTDGTFACILFLPFEGTNSFGRLSTAGDVIKFFQSTFPDVVPLMPELVDNFAANPVGAMVTIKCSPWHYEDKVLLLGDSAHAIVPFFGQGINCGFEDCTVLVELLDRHGPDWGLVFRKFEDARRVNTDAIADLAIENFIEMRDRVGHPRFLFRKKVELALQAKYPQSFVPKYSMVTFLRVPYATALRRGQIQDGILTDLCEHIDRVDDLDWQQAERLIRSQLTPLELS